MHAMYRCNWQSQCLHPGNKSASGACQRRPSVPGFPSLIALYYKHQAASGNILRNYAGSLPVLTGETPTALLAHSTHVLLPTPYSTGSLGACVMRARPCHADAYAQEGACGTHHVWTANMLAQNTRREEYSTTDKGIPSSPLPKLQQLVMERRSSARTRCSEQAASCKPPSHCFLLCTPKYTQDCPQV
jgi:hypothetical protein